MIACAGHGTITEKKSFKGKTGEAFKWIFQLGTTRGGVEVAIDEYTFNRFAPGQVVELKGYIKQGYKSVEIVATHLTECDEERLLLRQLEETKKAKAATAAATAVK